MGVQACPSYPGKHAVPSRGVEAATAPSKVRRRSCCTQLIHQTSARPSHTDGQGRSRTSTSPRVSEPQQQALLRTKAPVLLEADRSGLANLQTAPGPRPAVRHLLGSVPLAPALQLAGSRQSGAPAADAEGSAGLDAATGGLRGGSLASHDDQRQRREHLPFPSLPFFPA